LAGLRTLRKGSLDPQKKIALVYGPEGLKQIGVLLRKLEDTNRELIETRCERDMLLSENDVLRGIIDSLEHKMDVLEEMLDGTA
jgi:hypothetical protein